MTRIRNTTLYVVFCMLAFTYCSQPEHYSSYFTNPVLFGKVLSEEHTSATIFKNVSELTHLAQVKLIISKIPEDFEGMYFTLIGGGLQQFGFHGKHSTGFEGIGYHFAIPVDVVGNNPPRDENYKLDYTRQVKNGQLNFQIFYEPTDINTWGERYFKGSEVALNLMHKGTGERVLHASNNEFNWALANIGAGNSAEIRLSYPSTK